MKKLNLMILFLSLLMLTSCGKKNQNDQVMNDTTSKRTDSTAMSTPAKNEEPSFAMEAASGGMMEVALGKLASQKAASAVVKKFGRRMVTDHSKANNELLAIARKDSIMLPDSMMDKHKEMVDDLAKLNGSEFDKKYMDMMVDDHKEDVKKFEDASKDETNDHVKAWAVKTLPTLREHLNMAETIKDNLK